MASLTSELFLGLKVIDFSSSVGWNDSGSTLTVKMAPEDDDTITTYKIGEVLDFKFKSELFLLFCEINFKHPSLYI
jgi:hypothetical protein